MYARCANVLLCVREMTGLGVPIDRTTHYNWLKDDPVYAEAVNRALDDYKDRVNAEIDRRAIQGVDARPHHVQGRAGEERERAAVI